MINSLQLIIYLPLLSMGFPANLNLFLGYLTKIATFDMVPYISEIMDWVFNFEHSITDELPLPGYSQLSYGSLNFIMNIGSMFFFISWFLIYRLVAKCVKYGSKR